MTKSERAARKNNDETPATPTKKGAGSSFADAGFKRTLQVDTYEGKLAEDQKQIVLPIQAAHAGEYTMQLSWKAA